MTTTDLVARLRDEVLNRPASDDLYTDPDDYHAALTDAHERLYRLTATHAPGIIVKDHESNPISSDNGDGEVYGLGDDHYGQMEVWTPPGPPDGRVLIPVPPSSEDFGYYVQGQELHLTYEKDYDPGIYVRWIPATLTDLDADNNPVLPSYYEDALVYRAAYILAQKPGSGVDAGFYKREFNHAWGGDPELPSDAGLLGIISKQSAHGAWETRGGQFTPWYKRIS